MDGGKRKNEEIDKLPNLSPKKRLLIQFRKEEDEELENTRDVQLVWHTCPCRSFHNPYQLKTTFCVSCKFSTLFKCKLCKVIHFTMTDVNKHFQNAHGISLKTFYNVVPLFIKRNCTKCIRTYKFNLSIDGKEEEEELYNSETVCSKQNQHKWKYVCQFCEANSCSDNDPSTSRTKPETLKDYESMSKSDILIHVAFSHAKLPFNSKASNPS